MAEDSRLRQQSGATGVIVLADGTLYRGQGLGAEGEAVGELCFNTAMTGYQEVMTDPSYAGQIINFTFPHIGNVGANAEDHEGSSPHALGCVMAEAVTAPSSFRSETRFDQWLARWGRIGVSGVDTRAITRRIRKLGAPNAVIAHARDGRFNIDALVATAEAWSGLEGLDLAKEVSCTGSWRWDEGSWKLGQGYRPGNLPADAPHVVAIDYGMKRAILRQLVDAGARVTVVPATPASPRSLRWSRTACSCRTAPATRRRLRSTPSRSSGNGWRRRSRCSAFALATSCSASPSAPARKRCIRATAAQIIPCSSFATAR